MLGTPVDCAKSAEPITARLAGRLPWSQEARAAQRRHPVNTTERSVRGGDAALHKTSLATCLHYRIDNLNWNKNRLLEYWEKKLYNNEQKMQTTMFPIRRR